MEKILIDTNLILRYFVDGDNQVPELAKSHMLWITNEVVFEVVHSLMSFYKRDRQQVFTMMADFLMKPNVESDRILLIDTLASFKDKSNLSFVDCFLWNLSKREKIRLETYDKKLKKKL